MLDSFINFLVARTDSESFQLLETNYFEFSIPLILGMVIIGKLSYTHLEVLFLDILLFPSLYFWIYLDELL